MAKKRKLLLVFVLLLALVAILAQALVKASNQTSAKLLDGSHVILDGVTYGLSHVQPVRKCPWPLSLLSPRVRYRLGWHDGGYAMSTMPNQDVLFWLKYPYANADQWIHYGIADDSGFESPVVFTTFTDYHPAGFGTNTIGRMRGFGLLPPHSKMLHLRLHQRSTNEEWIRIADFIVTNFLRTNISTWHSTPLPAVKRELGLEFVLKKAVVGVYPSVPLQDDSRGYPGQWSEFTFEVRNNGAASSGWDIREITIDDESGQHVRTSAEDILSLNRTFSRIVGDEIICTHRWEFWNSDPAWKLRVHYIEAANGNGPWIEYLVRPEFLRSSP